MADAVTDRTRLIFVCNPNNPTGTVVRRAELERFLDRVPSRRAGGARRGVPRVHPRRRGARRRRALPGPARTWRCCGPSPRRTAWPGCGSVSPIAHEPVAAALRKTAVPFGVSQLAQDAAVAVAARRGRAAGAGRRRWSPSGPGWSRRWPPRAGRCRRRRPTSSGCGSASAPLDFAAACEQAGVVGPAVRRRGRADHDRRDRGQRSAAAVRPRRSARSCEAALREARLGCRRSRPRRPAAFAP